MRHPRLQSDQFCKEMDGKLPNRMTIYDKSATQVYAKTEIWTQNDRLHTHSHFKQLPNGNSQ